MMSQDVERCSKGDERDVSNKDITGHLQMMGEDLILLSKDLKR